jgi:hypothetical protein
LEVVIGTNVHMSPICPKYPCLLAKTTDRKKTEAALQKNGVLLPNEDAEIGPLSKPRSLPAEFSFS